MLLISRSIDLRMITCISFLYSIYKLSFLFFPSSAPSSSSQYLLLFLESPRSCVVLLPTPFTSTICPSMTSCRRHFLLRIWSIQLAFLRKSVLFYRIRSTNYSFVVFSDHFIFTVLLHHHISKDSKYFRSNVLNVQVSEPYKAMLKTLQLTNFFLSYTITLLFSLNGFNEWWFFWEKNITKSWHILLNQ